MNVYVPCRVSVRDQGEHVVNVWHVLGQRIVDSVTSARYCVTKQNLLQDEASPWESFIWIQWNILALYLLLVCSKVWEKKKLVFKENWVSSCMTERLNGLLTDWLNDWMTNWLTEWLTEWLTDWLTDWMGNCKKSSPKLVTDTLLTANQQVTDRLRKKKNCVKNEQLTRHNNP